MPLDPDRDTANEDFEEDDMPPLVDNDNPSPTYTFSPGMTPLSFTSTSASTATRDINLQSSTSLISPPPTSPVTPDENTSTFSMPLAQARPSGKRRDPSYIPRPPNAFILFRCAFIKEQNVPGKVEGNHSKLSKIIGLCWRQLSPEEREKWEAKAIVAQAEHRAHYPDWRFRPGANALVKSKVKDEGGTVSTRRRSVRSRTKDVAVVEEREDDDFVVSEAKGKGKEKARAKSKSTRLLSIEETRCAKIAGFVAEGIKGEELEVAVKQWEGDHRIPKAVSKPSRSKGRGPSGTSSAPSHVRSHSDVALTTESFSPAPNQFQAEPSDTPTPTPTEGSSTSTPKKTHNRSPPDPGSGPTNSDPTSALPDLPLTHMFKRSLSAPAPNHRLPYPQSSGPSESSSDDFSTESAEPSPPVWGTFKHTDMQEAPTRTHTHVRRDTISFPMPSHQAAAPSDFPHLTWQEAENQRRMEEMQNPDTWWTQKAPMEDSRHYTFEDNQEERHSVDLSINNMGYDVPDGGSQFDRGYREQYGSYEIANQDGSQHIEWSDMSANNRQGLGTVIEDPYQDDCNNNSPSIASPPTLSLPPLSNSGLYYSNHPPVAPPISFPSSSFSTLTGWAGDYKYQHSEPRAWSNQPPPLSAPPGWYNSQSSFNWGMTRPQVEHAHLSHDSEDWDRLEHRAASDLGLQVEPPRQLTFDDEIRRLQHRAR